MKQPTISPATLLSIRVIHDMITDDIDKPADLADLLSEPSGWHGGAIQTIETRLQGSPWHGVEIMDSHTSVLGVDIHDGTYAQALVRLIKAIFGASVAGDIEPFLLDPSLITADWS